jgi:hypothetical protein
MYLSAHNISFSNKFLLSIFSLYFLKICGTFFIENSKFCQSLELQLEARDSKSVSEWKGTDFRSYFKLNLLVKVNKWIIPILISNWRKLYTVHNGPSIQNRVIFSFLTQNQAYSSIFALFIGKFRVCSWRKTFSTI